ncbi:MAG: aryl-sulfate sulfotransferase [Deltaproteobacteria bacterium]|nr:aryl-sulfate sulfotransferase [Deltaproteobacteria bacterium]
MKKSLFFLAACFFLTMTASSAYAVHAHVGQTELLYYNKAKAYPGYVLFSAGHPDLVWATYLIDIEGRLINVWDIGDMPRFLENGNLFDFTIKRGAKGVGKPGFRELDWDGNIMQEVLIPENRSDIDRLHHQKQRIFNKALNAYTYISIISKKLTHEEGLAAGADPSKCTGDSIPDGIIEVDMAGNIVWEWWTVDHVVQDEYPDKLNYVGKGKKISDYPGKLDMNQGRGLVGDFVHFNSIDYNPTLGQIAVNNSTGSEFWIVDHDAAPSFLAITKPARH